MGSPVCIHLLLFSCIRKPSFSTSRATEETLRTPALQRLLLCPVGHNISSLKSSLIHFYLTGWLLALVVTFRWTDLLSERVNICRNLFLLQRALKIHHISFLASKHIFKLSIITKQIIWKLSGLKQPCLSAHKSMGLEVGKNAVKCSCLRHTESAMAAGPGRATSQMACIYIWRHSVLGLCLLPHMVFLLPRLLLHVVWASSRMLVSESSLLLQGNWLPEGRKQKLPGYFRATPRTGTTPSIVFHRSKQPQALPRLRRNRSKLHLWWWGVSRSHWRRRCACGRHCWNHLRKIDSSKGGEPMTDQQCVIEVTMCSRHAYQVKHLTRIWEDRQASFPRGGDVETESWKMNGNEPDQGERKFQAEA